jgi:hypothetical protein
MMIVECEGFKLSMGILRYDNEDPIITRYRRAYVRYHAITPNGTVFTGDEFSPSPNDKWHSPSSAFQLLFWLTLTPDSGSEIFNDYTAEQMTWANSPECEALAAIFGEEEILRKFSGEEYELNYDSRGMVYTVAYGEEWGGDEELEMIVRYS